MALENPFDLADLIQLAAMTAERDPAFAKRVDEYLRESGRSSVEALTVGELDEVLSTWRSRPGQPD